MRIDSFEEGNEYTYEKKENKSCRLQDYDFMILDSDPPEEAYLLDYEFSMAGREYLYQLLEELDLPAPGYVTLETIEELQDYYSSLDAFTLVRAPDGTFVKKPIDLMQDVEEL